MAPSTLLAGNGGVAGKDRFEPAVLGRSLNLTLQLARALPFGIARRLSRRDGVRQANLLRGKGLRVARASCTAIRRTPCEERGIFLAESLAARVSPGDDRGQEELSRAEEAGLFAARPRPKSFPPKTTRGRSSRPTGNGAVPDTDVETREAACRKDRAAS